MARTSVLLFSLFTFHWQLIRVWGSVAQQVPLDQLPTNSLQDGASTSKGFPLSPIDPDEASSYKFKWPTRRIAIIGAGDGGLLAYRELTEAGLDVHIFERDHAPGGNWHYSKETPLDVPIPNVDVSIGDYAPDLPPHGVTLPYEVIQKEDDEGFRRRRRVFRGPKPVWASLTSNSPAPHQQLVDCGLAVASRYSAGQNSGKQTRVLVVASIAVNSTCRTQVKISKLFVL